MINPTQLSLVSGGVYAITLAVILARMRRLPDRLHRYCHLLLLVIGLAAVHNFLSVASIGTVVMGGTPVQLTRLINDVVGFSILWGIVALLGNAPRRYLAIAAGLQFVQITTFQFITAVSGPLGLVLSAVNIGGHLVFLYLFWGPIWEFAKQLPDHRRLLYWKTRNLLWFLNGMLIVFAYIFLAGMFSMFGVSVIGAYLSVLTRVGFAGLVLVNVHALDDEGSGTDAAGDGLSPAAYGSTAPDAAD